MIQILSKSIELAESYKLISLLPILLILFEKLLLPRISIIMESHELIPDYQFDFRSKHKIIEQIYRIVKRINNDIEVGRYCTAVFFDLLQAFDKVWHERLLYEIKNSFPNAVQITITPAYRDESAYSTTALILRSLTKYLLNRVNTVYNWKHIAGLELANRTPWVQIRLIL